MPTRMFQTLHVDTALENEEKCAQCPEPQVASEPAVTSKHVKITIPGLWLCQHAACVKKLYHVNSVAAIHVSGEYRAGTYR